VRVFITGAANGIGKATTEKLVENDHKVIAYDKDESSLENLPNQVQTYEGDVEDQERLQEVMRKEIFGVLINCAGVQKQGAVEDMAVEDFEEHIDTNYLGTVKATKAALPMIRERDGRIINISSVAGKLTAPFLGGYSASKHAVEGFTDTLRMEMKDTDVEVVLVEPGPIKTGFNEKGRENLKEYLPETKYSKKYKKKLEKDYSGSKVSKPAQKILKAVEAKRPRARYSTPLKYTILLKLKFLIPTSIQDYVAGNR